jgi:hypothetical protein
MVVCLDSPRSRFGGPLPFDTGNPRLLPEQVAEPPSRARPITLDSQSRIVLKLSIDSAQELLVHEPRLSSYTISSTPIDGQHVIIMNALSGAIDVVPAALGELFSRYNPRLGSSKYCSQLGALSSETVAELEKRGHLTRRTHQSEQELAAAISDALFDEQRKIPSLWSFHILIVTTAAHIALNAHFKTD